MKRIGVLGGSFDPIHRGHVSLGKDALNQANLDFVVFVPVHRQPFKLDFQMSSDDQRFSMVQYALEGEEGLMASDWELKQKGISYTYLTLRGLKLLWPDADLFYITGTDTFLKIKQWKNAIELLQENRFIVGHRPGYRDEELYRGVEQLEKIYQTQITVINNTRLEISATEIRTRVKNGEPISHLVPEGVERYIKEHGLYL